MSTADGTVLGSTQIFGTAPRNRAFNVVLLAEGFTDAQQADFNTACGSFVTAFSGTPPFDELAPAINVFRVNVSSTDSGADDPASAGGTGAVVRTYFDATFGGNGIRRLLLCNTTTALQVAAAQVPEFTVAIVVVNSTIYGGSGGSVGTYSLAGGATEIAIHEMGHTAFDLADEYPYYAGGNETGHDHHPAGEPGEPNVTTNTDRNTLKWRWAVSSTTAIPTMSNPNCAQVDSRPSSVPAGTVGLFEGAHYYHCGGFRPEYDCKMRNLGVPFCAVAARSFWNRISPLATMQARANDADHRACPLSRASRRVCGRLGRPHHEQLVGPIQRLGRMVPGAGRHQRAGRHRIADHRRARYAGHLDLFTVGTDNRVYSAWWDVSSGWHGWFPIGTLVCRPGSTVNVGVALQRSPRSLHQPPTGESCRRGGTRARGWAPWFQVPGGVAAAGARSPPSLATRFISTCSPSARTTASTARGGTTAAAGRPGSPSAA